MGNGSGSKVGRVGLSWLLLFRAGYPFGRKNLALLMLLGVFGKGGANRGGDALKVNGKLDRCFDLLHPGSSTACKSPPAEALVQDHRE